MTMMDTNDSRFPKALEIAAQAGQWAKCRMVDGRKLYAIPSQRDPNVRYLTDATRCTCVDFKRHGEACKHVRAVQIHCALVRAEQRQPKRHRLQDPISQQLQQPVYTRWSTS